MFKLQNMNHDLGRVSHCLWHEMTRFKLIKRCFYDGSITDPVELEAVLSDCSTVIGYEDSKMACAIWIQNAGHRIGHIHFVSFPPFKISSARQIVKDYLDSKLDRTRKSCYTIMIGISPYESVSKYFHRWGFSDPVRLPEYHYDAYKNKYVDCWQIFLTDKTR